MSENVWDGMVRWERSRATTTTIERLFQLGESLLYLCERNFTRKNGTAKERERDWRAAFGETMLARRRFTSPSRDAMFDRTANEAESTDQKLTRFTEKMRTYAISKIIHSLDYLSAAVKICVRIYSEAFASYVKAYQRDSLRIGRESSPTREPRRKRVAESKSLKETGGGRGGGGGVGGEEERARVGRFRRNDSREHLDLNYSVKMLDWLLCLLDNDENFSSLWACVKSTANFEEATTTYDTPVVFSSGGILGLGICERRYVIECELEMRLYRTLDRLGKLDLFDAAKNILNGHLGQIKRFIHMYERAVNLKSDPELVARNLNKFFQDVETMTRNMFYVVLMNVEQEQVLQAFNNIHSGVDTVKQEILAILQNFRGRNESTNEMESMSRDSGNDHRERITKSRKRRHETRRQDNAADD